MRVLSRLISVSIKIILLGILGIVYLPISIMDFLWVHLVDPSEANKRQKVIAN